MTHLARLLILAALALPGLAFGATPVNINQASAAQIAKALDGVGPAKAQAVVAWREAHGAFKSVDELKFVKGFGKATIERNRDAIVLGNEVAPPAAPLASAKAPGPDAPAGE